jgi:hypothetical protein
VTVSQFSKFAAPFVSLVLFAAVAGAQLKIGSSNTASADPPVPRPHTKPCIVPLYKGFIFDDFNPRTFTYTPPAACPGPWAKVILAADFSVSAGIQFDRTANIWFGPTNVYFGTTSEPSSNAARNWHVERDLTDYSSIFTVTQAGTVDLGNIVNSTYTGVIHGSGNLLFYPLAPAELAPASADQVIAFSSGPTGGTVGLNTGTDLLEQTLTLPTNIRNVFFDVFSQSQSNDEFWYTCVPNDVAGQLESCGGTSFRESEVTIDGTPAGVAPVYPWIYTGGLDPFLWFPIPGVQTLNFLPYRVNLTPFASLLNNGQPHTIALSVFNADSYFSATGSLLLYLDHNATALTGAITENTLAIPVPNIGEHVRTASNGDVHGSVNTRASHNFKISGYLNTPSGPITTTVAQDINFSNLQTFSILAASYEQKINQATTIHSIVTTHNSTGVTVNSVNHSYPVTLDITLLFNADGSGVQTTTINQYYERDQSAVHNGVPTTSSVVRNRVTPTDSLDFSPSFNITGNQNQSSEQNYFTTNSTGYCYSRDIQAAGNVLTTVTDGTGCN